MSNIRYYVEHEKPWIRINGVPIIAGNDAEFSVVSPDNDDIMVVGRPIRFQDTASPTVWYYGIVNSVSDVGDTLTIGFDGYPMSTSLDDAMEYGPMSLVVVETFLLNGVWNDVASTTSVLTLYTGLYYRWRHGTAHLVASYSRTVSVDTGVGDGKYTPYINGVEYFSPHQEPTTSWETKQDNTDVVSLAATEIEIGEYIEIRVSNTGTNKDAKDLTIQMTFVVTGENS